MCWCVSEISRNTRVIKGAVHKVEQHFALHVTTKPFSCGGSEPILITDDILEVIEIWKLWKLSLYASEICARLLREGICTPANVPSIRQIQTVTNKKLGMTYKKLTSIPSEYMTPENLAKVEDYLNKTSRLKREALESLSTRRSWQHERQRSRVKLDRGLRSWREIGRLSSRRFWDTDFYPCWHVFAKRC